MFKLLNTLKEVAIVSTDKYGRKVVLQDIVKNVQSCHVNSKDMVIINTIGLVDCLEVRNLYDIEIKINGYIVEETAGEKLPFIQTHSCEGYVLDKVIYSAGNGAEINIVKYVFKKQPNILF